MLTNEQWQHCPLQHVKQTTSLHPALEKQAKEKKKEQVEEDPEKPLGLV